MNIWRLTNSYHWIKSFGVYALSNVINAAIPFLLLPVLTIHLTPSDYGIISSINAMISVLVPIIGLNLMSSIQVVFVKQSMDMGKYLSTGVVTLLFLTFVFTILLWMFSPILGQWLNLPSDYIVFVAIYAMHQNIVETLLSVWRMQNKAGRYGLFRILRTILELIIALSLIVFFEFKYDGAMKGLTYSYGMMSLIALWIMVKDHHLKLFWERNHFLHLLQFGGKLVPHVLGGVIMVFADKLVIAHYHGQSENGIYAVGFTVAQVIGLLQNSFNQAWSPWAMEQLKLNTVERKLKMVKWTYLYFIVILFAVFAFYFFSPFVFSVLGSDFAKGSEMVLYIALGFAFNGMYKMIAVYYFYGEHTGELSVITICTAALNVLLLYLWVPRYGYFGASWSILVSFFLQFVFTWLGSMRIIRMPWLLKR